MKRTFLGSVPGYTVPPEQLRKSVDTHYAMEKRGHPPFRKRGHPHSSERIFNRCLSGQKQLTIYEAIPANSQKIFRYKGWLSGASNPVQAEGLKVIDQGSGRFLWPNRGWPNRKDIAQAD